jgi:lipid-binding SYLF domain-containing protein
MDQDIQKAIYTVLNTFSVTIIKDSNYPLTLLREAMGLVFMTVLKGGFMFAPRIGTGLIVSRLSDGRWSAPCAIGTMGISWGFLAGIGVTDYLIILRTPEAVQSFTGNGQVTIGGELEVAVGPLGRSGAADIHAGAGVTAPAVSYSHSKGIYAGISLDGSAILTRLIL